MSTTYRSLMPLEPVQVAVNMMVTGRKKELTYKLWGGCAVHRVFISLNMEDVPSAVIVTQDYETGGVHSINWDNSKIEARGKDNLLIHLAHWIVNTINVAAIGTGFGAGTITEIIEELN